MKVREITYTCCPLDFSTRSALIPFLDHPLTVVREVNVVKVEYHFFHHILVFGATFILAVSYLMLEI